MKYCIFESGSKGNCSVVFGQDVCVCFDCGGPKKIITEGFQSLGLEPSSCAALFLSHGHSDHIKNVKSFERIPIYSTFDVHSVQNETLLTAFEPVKMGNLTITPIPLSHDFEGTVGFVVEDESEKLVILTDTGYVSDRVLPYIVNADYYIFESNHDPEMLNRTSRPLYLKIRILGDEGHLSNRDCGIALTKCITARTKEIFLAHISDEANDMALARETVLNVLDEHEVNYTNIRIEPLAQFATVKGGQWHD